MAHGVTQVKTNPTKIADALCYRSMRLFSRPSPRSRHHDQSNCQVSNKTVATLRPPRCGDNSICRSRAATTQPKTWNTDLKLCYGPNLLASGVAFLPSDTPSRRPAGKSGGCARLCGIRALQYKLIHKVGRRPHGCARCEGATAAGGNHKVWQKYIFLNTFPSRPNGLKTAPARIIPAEKGT